MEFQANQIQIGGRSALDSGLEAYRVRARDQQGPSIEGEILTVMIRNTILDRRGGSENKG
jgi:hypothetical protein